MGAEFVAPLSKTQARNLRRTDVREGLHVLRQDALDAIRRVKQREVGRIFEACGFTPEASAVAVRMFGAASDDAFAWLEDHMGDVVAHILPDADVDIAAEVATLDALVANADDGGAQAVYDAVVRAEGHVDRVSVRFAMQRADAEDALIRDLMLRLVPTV